MDNQLEMEALQLISQMKNTIINASVQPNIDKSELRSLQNREKSFDDLIQRHHDAILSEHKRFHDSVVSLFNSVNNEYNKDLQTPVAA